MRARERKRERERFHTHSYGKGKFEEDFQKFSERLLGDCTFWKLFSERLRIVFGVVVKWQKNRGGKAGVHVYSSV